MLACNDEGKHAGVSGWALDCSKAFKAHMGPVAPQNHQEADHSSGSVTKRPPNGESTYLIHKQGKG